MELAILEKKLQEIKDLLEGENKYPIDFFKNVNDEYLCSAQNLIHYLELRNIDIREIQNALTQLGISSLGTSAGYVHENVSRCLGLVRIIQGLPQNIDLSRPVLGFEESTTLLQARSKSLFNISRSKTKIMVTMPNEAAEDITLLKGMFSAGMDMTRINLSHGDSELWNRMIKNIAIASEALKLRNCVFMDLPGPKIRVEHLYKQLADKKGFRQVASVSIAKGDHFELIKEADNTSILDKARHTIITVLLPEIVDDLEIGHRIFFDDGAIEGLIISESIGSVIVKITNATKKKLRISKGINLPDTHLSLPSLTENDLRLLPYACENADIIGYSFVRTPEDVALLNAKLLEIGDTSTGVVFKIETKEAFENLPRILLEAMKRPKIGVMIARGDLAVEIGFDRISEVKSQIMNICEAAHVPVIWATQVLENMAKKGLATRAEISDVILSSHAECVMLNKGTYMTDTVVLLKNILERMEEHSNKNKKTLRALGVAGKNLSALQTKSF